MLNYYFLLFCSVCDIMFFDIEHLVLNMHLCIFQTFLVNIYI